MVPQPPTNDPDPRRQPDEEAFVAHLQADDDGSIVCTIAPAGPRDEAIGTEWIAATEGSFVPLAETR